MNEVIRQLMERKSVRVYTDQAISPDEKRAILHAAMAAPTAGNQQLYTILDITGNESSSHVCFYLLFDLRNLLYLNLSANPLFLPTACLPEFVSSFCRQRDVRPDLTGWASLCHLS